MAAVGNGVGRLYIVLRSCGRRLENTVSRTTKMSMVSNVRNVRTNAVAVASPSGGSTGSTLIQSRRLHTANWVLSDSADSAEAQKNVSNRARKTEVLLDELIQLIDSDAIRLIDVREPNEIEETGSIPSSINIPVTHLKNVLSLGDEEFFMTFGVKKPRKDDTDVVYYGLSSVKSAAAVEIAQKLGYKRARHYTGGWDEWSLKCRSESTY